MSILFWVLVVTLILLAIGIVIVPIIVNRQLISSDKQQHNITIARQRLADLKQSHANNQLSDTDFKQQSGEIELALGYDLEAEADSTPAQSSQGKWAIPILVWFIPFLSLLSYLMLGDLDALTKLEKQNQISQQRQNDQQTIENMVAGLAEKMKQNPDDAKGWQMLGRSYKAMKKFDQAAEAYGQAYRLLGDQTEIMLLYADALGLQQGTLKGKAAELVTKAVQQEPENTTGLWLAGMAQAEQGHLQTALQHWLKLKTLIKPDTKEYNDLNSLIGSLQQRIGEQPASATNDAPAASATGINVSVSLDENWGDKVSQSDTLFIYAQALQGPKMPLAIAKKQVSDLPLSVELNDSMAMMPGMTLSSFEQVKVIARISKSGTAMPQAGDVMGFQVVKDKQATPSVQVEINQLMP